MSLEKKIITTLQIQNLVSNSMLRGLFVILFHNGQIQENQLLQLPETMEEVVKRMIKNAGEPDPAVDESLEKQIKADFDRWRFFANDLIEGKKTIDEMTDRDSFPDFIFDDDDGDDKLN